MQSTTSGKPSPRANLDLALADAGSEQGVQVHPFGSVPAGSPHPADVDLALIYATGRRDAALALRERLREAVRRRMELPCDFIVVSVDEARTEQQAPQLRDNIFASINLAPSADDQR